jgi:hypothetical protein
MQTKNIIPRQFLFRIAFPCNYSPDFSNRSSRNQIVERTKSTGNKRTDEALDRHIVELGPTFKLPYFGQIDGQSPFADVQLAWNETGLGIAWEVHQKQESIYGEEGSDKAGDGISLWIDTRDARNVHRATRYCQRFNVLVHNGKKDGSISVVQPKINRALEDSPSADLSLIQTRRFAITREKNLDAHAASVDIKSYRMEVYLPAEVLHGFEPENNSRLGFFYRIRDKEKGDQFLTVGAEFPFWEDPSVWSVLELNKRASIARKTTKSKTAISE